VVRWSFCLLLCLQALLWAGPASARPPGEEGERQQRRMELRQHIEAERERWHADGRRGGAQAPGGPGPRGDAPPAHGYGGPMRHGQPPGFAPPAGGRLSPEERRALRQELRNQRP
jgi:uncharacterized membrane protein